MQATGSLFKAIVRQRCPACRQGPVFRGMFTMNKNCAVCGLLFEREPGYFLGAMFVSYILSALVLTAWMVLLGLFRRFLWSDRIILACILFIPCVPWVFRLSRVLWITIDRKID